jgi:type VI protein secretion system component Hcp
MRAYVIIGATLALAITPAIAGDKSGGGGHTATQNHPQENISLSYGKVEHTYTQQKPNGTAQATGKRIQTPSKIRRSDGGGSTVGR